MMEPLAPAGCDPHLIAAILQSDAIIHALQRELRQIDPNCLVPSDTLRALLRTHILRGEMLHGEQAAAARSRLVQAMSAYAEKRRTRSTGTFAAVNLDDPDEHVGDTLWHDKTQATGGG
jgi:hypothetical protein